MGNLPQWSCLPNFDLNGMQALLQRRDNAVDRFVLDYTPMGLSV